MNKKTYYKKQLVLKEEKNQLVNSEVPGQNVKTALNNGKKENPEADKYTIPATVVDGKNTSETEIETSEENLDGITGMVRNMPQQQAYKTNIVVRNGNKPNVHDSFHRDGTLVEGVTFTKKELSDFLMSL